VDETAFRQARKAAVEHPCPFEKALLAGCGCCALSRRRHIAERETVACREADACADCAALLGRLRRNAAFALHLAHPEERLTHAREMKVQCGGLVGLHRTLTDADAVGDVGALVQTACRSENGLDGLPWSAIMQSVAAWQPRRRARRQ
jgi:hypothetical protein